MHAGGADPTNYPQPKPLKSKLRQYIVVWLLALLSISWTTFTIFFAYNSSMLQPVAPALIPATPQNAILAINIFSQITIFLLGELSVSVFEAIRWSIASSGYGISAFSFIVLSRATSNLGVLRLLSRFKTKSGKSFRIWGTQRFSPHCIAH